MEAISYQLCLHFRATDKFYRSGKGYCFSLRSEIRIENFINFGVTLVRPLRFGSNTCTQNLRETPHGPEDFILLAVMWYLVLYLTSVYKTPISLNLAWTDKRLLSAKFTQCSIVLLKLQKMNSTPAATTSSENATGSSRIVFSKAEGIAFSIAFIFSFLAIVIGYGGPQLSRQ